jgi:hypothetical protein
VPDGEGLAIVMIVPCHNKTYFHTDSYGDTAIPDQAT